MLIYAPFFHKQFLLWVCLQTVIKKYGVVTYSANKTTVYLLRYSLNYLSKSMFLTQSIRSYKHGPTMLLTTPKVVKDYLQYVQHYLKPVKSIPIACF